MKRQNLIILLLNLKKDSQSISKNRLNLMQYTACLVFNPDTVKNFTFLFKCTPVGAWALRLNDGTELKLSYRWEGPDNKLRLRDKHMSLVGSTKVEIVVFFCSRRFSVSALLLSPRFCFITVFTFVFCDASLTSYM